MKAVRPGLFEVRISPISSVALRRPGSQERAVASEEPSLAKRLQARRFRHGTPLVPNQARAVVSHYISVPYSEQLPLMQCSEPRRYPRNNDD